MSGISDLARAKGSAPMVSPAGRPQPGRACVNCAVLFFRGCRAARQPGRPRGPRDDLLIKAGGRGQPERVHHVRGTAYSGRSPAAVTSASQGLGLTGKPVTESNLSLRAPAQIPAAMRGGSRREGIALLGTDLAAMR